MLLVTEIRSPLWTILSFTYLYHCTECMLCYNQWTELLDYSQELGLVHNRSVINTYWKNDRTSLYSIPSFSISQITLIQYLPPCFWILAKCLNRYSFYILSSGLFPSVLHISLHPTPILKSSKLTKGESRNSLTWHSKPSSMWSQPTLPEVWPELSCLVKQSVVTDQTACLLPSLPALWFWNSWLATLHLSQPHKLYWNR